MSYEPSWTSWNDLNICKQMLQNLNAMELRVTVDYHSGRCCGNNQKLVRNVYIGRYAGVEVCDICIEREQEFIEYLKQLPTEPPPEIEQEARIPQISKTRKTKYQKVSKKLESMLETRQEKEARKARMIREILEKNGQGSLF